ADLTENEALGGSVDYTERWERLEWLNQGLNLLDERCRNLLLALYFDPEQPAYAQVAERLGMPVGSIGPTRARCLEKMKQNLAENVALPGAGRKAQRAPRQSTLVLKSQ
ncbi:MAG: hypothetical protein ACRDH2_17990, partial [Anaerolineales bacterium]